MSTDPAALSPVDAFLSQGQPTDAQKRARAEQDQRTLDWITRPASGPQTYTVVPAAPVAQEPPAPPCNCMCVHGRSVAAPAGAQEPADPFDSYADPDVSRCGNIECQGCEKDGPEITTVPGAHCRPEVTPADDGEFL